MNVTIYALCCPITSEARYVGKTIDLYIRVRAHLYEKSPSYKKNWLTSLKKNGLKPLVRVLEIIENSNDEDWQERERWWIKSLKEDGCRLTNQEDGGLGGKLLTDEIKNKISISNRGRKPHASAIENSVKARKGKKASEETIAKMKASKAGTVPSDACVAASKKKNTGRKMPQEVKDKISASKQNQPPRPQEVRDKISKSMIGMEFSDSHKQALSENALLREMKKFLHGLTVAEFKEMIYGPTASQTPLQS